jgi:hypothetical protein
MEGGRKEQGWKVGRERNRWEEGWKSRDGRSG